MSLPKYIFVKLKNIHIKETVHESGKCFDTTLDKMNRIAIYPFFLSFSFLNYSGISTFRREI